MNKTLYLIPCTLGDTPVQEVLPQFVIDIVNLINTYIVENERTARRFLIRLGIQTPIDRLTMYTLNKHTSDTEAQEIFSSVKEWPVGLLSEAGVPCIADPGKQIVLAAHQQQVKVVPLTGPSSILMGLMASGLNGQNFAFNGYLPVKSPERIKKIRQLEQRSAQENQSQVFMETPYRNNQLFADILKSCTDNTLFTVASELTTGNEYIVTQTIKEWKKTKIDLHKKPVVYVIHKL
jgi:16S rRNA (cytidine1402-2'-O)-methyltransferase